IATTLPALKANSLVILPMPGPTSITRSLLSIFAASTIRLIIVSSRRKFCPSKRRSLVSLHGIRKPIRIPPTRQLMASRSSPLKSPRAFTDRSP
ncbi:MAG: hypothetical protein MUP41_12360, partial [Desulfobacterales bacterium]|nr:hypothetical protein [Desulfobacterales bacterium]